MRKLLVLLMIFVLILGTVTGCGQKESAASTTGEGTAENTSEEAAKTTYQWRFAHEEPTDSIQDKYVKKFAEVINEKSDGRIAIDVYPVGQIGDATQQAELLQNGGLEFAMVSPGNTGTLVPENQLFSLHFLFSDDMEKNFELFKTSKALNETLNAEYEKKSIKVLSYWTEGFMQWTSSKAVNTPDAFKGFKMRTMPSPMIVASYEAYGANPTPVPYMEVYSGLQLNMIEGQENPLDAIEDMKFYEVQDYLTLSNASLYVTTTATNPDFFNGLPADIQQIVLDTVDELRDYSAELQADLNGSALEKIKSDSDINVSELTDEERQQFKEASKSARQVYIDMVGEKGEEILAQLEEEVAALQ